jgi:hypothetical protein
MIFCRMNNEPRAASAACFFCSREARCAVRLKRNRQRLDRTAGESGENRRQWRDSANRFGKTQPKGGGLNS